MCKAASTPGSQKISVTSSASAAAFTVAASTSGGGGWLGATPANGQTPASISVSVTPSGLARRGYNGQVTITPANGTAAVASAGDPERAGAVDAELHAAERPGDGGHRVFGDLHGERRNGSLQLVDRGGSAAGRNGVERVERRRPRSAGQPSGAGGYSYLVQVADSTSPTQSATQAFSGTVSAQPGITVSPGTLIFSYQRGGNTPPAQSAHGIRRASWDCIHGGSEHGERWKLAVRRARLRGRHRRSISVSVNVAGLADGHLHRASQLQRAGGHSADGQRGGDADGAIGRGDHELRTGERSGDGGHAVRGTVQRERWNGAVHAGRSIRDRCRTG